MNTDVGLTLILPWFPILLGVGVGGRLLGRMRGLFLGCLCALFWIVLVQASAGPVMWQDPWVVAAVVAGAIAIAGIGCWSGETAIQDAAATGRAHPPDSETSDVAEEASQSAFQKLSSAIEQFDAWLEEHCEQDNPWPNFDELVRSVMYQCCEATHVKPLRLLDEEGELAPVRELDPATDVERLPARKGIVGHVVTTGCSYIVGDVTQGELLGRLAEESQDSIAWCFPIRRGKHRLGVVVVGRLGIDPIRNKSLVRAVERILNQFWCMLDETVRSRSAAQQDPVSGLPTRPAFLRDAGQSVLESYQQGEPVAVAVIALEGLREMSDSGRWELADEVVRAVGDSLRRKVRMDDGLGRFDGSRFIFMLRRVDSELASLIVAQLMTRLSELCSDEARWGRVINVRCGIAGSGTDSPDLRVLVLRALAQCRQARIEDLQTLSDVGSETTVSGAPA